MNLEQNKRQITPGARLSIAPMMAWTTPEQRYFMRLIAPHALLYTEMVTTGALIHGDAQHFLGYHSSEHPLALQLGGSEPKALAQCAQLAQAFGYDEVNINIGCPSERVKNGAFGACLMAEPKRVADCVRAMKQVVDIPVTVKTRIGIDHQDSYDFLYQFCDDIDQAGADYLIVHARKAWLSGLSPKENRNVPPLDYARVYRLAADFPNLPMSINGGIQTLTQARQHLAHVHGVMMGRQAYKIPYSLAEIDQALFNSNQPLPSRFDIIERLKPFTDQHLAQGGQLKDITRHILGLFHGQTGGRIWRRMLSEHSHKKGANFSVIQAAADAVQSSIQHSQQALAS